jgi:hypothetical protein
MFLSLLPIHQWGKEFVVPADSTYFYVFAESETQVIITRPGQLPVTHLLPAKTNIKLSNSEAGTTISADSLVYVLAVNCQPDQNFPWMYNVLPVSYIGTDYYHDASYVEYDISWPWPADPDLWITTVNASTTVYIDENNDGNPEFTHNLGAADTVIYEDPLEGAHIWATDKIYVVYVENWTRPYGRWGPASQKYGGASTEYIPTSSYGINYAVVDPFYKRTLPENNPRIFIVAAEDSTEVNIDFNWDGTDVSNVIDKGEVWTVLWPEGVSYTAHVWSNKGIQVIYRTDTSHNDHPGVNLAYTATPLIKEIIVDIDIKPGSDPNSINPRSKGKIPVAILTTDSFDAAAVDPTTILFGRTGEEASPVHYAFEDVDDDGDNDMILHFNTQDTGIQCGDTEAFLTGETLSGITIKGSDSIRTVGCK